MVEKVYERQLCKIAIVNEMQFSLTPKKRIEDAVFIFKKSQDEQRKNCRCFTNKKKVFDTVLKKVFKLTMWKKYKSDDLVGSLMSRNEEAKNELELIMSNYK